MRFEDKGTMLLFSGRGLNTTLIKLMSDTNIYI